MWKGKNKRYVHKEIVRDKLKEKGIIWKEKEAVEEIFNLTDILMETILDEVVKLYKFENKKYNRKLLSKDTVDLAFENILVKRWEEHK